VQCGFGVRTAAVKSNRSVGEGCVFVWRSGAPGANRGEVPSDSC
jgi:hypothetical protein